METETKEMMSIEEIEAAVGIMLVAGSETSSTALAVITNCLLKNPEKLERLVEEVRGLYRYSDEITFATVSKQLYLAAVIEEGFRMFPPIPGGGHRVVPSGGDTICGVCVPGNVCCPPSPM